LNKEKQFLKVYKTNIQTKQRRIQMLLNSVMNYRILSKLILQQHMLRRLLEVFPEVLDQLVLTETK
jgi:hypothetical protein